MVDTDCTKRIGYRKVRVSLGSSVCHIQGSNTRFSCIAISAREGAKATIVRLKTFGRLIIGLEPMSEVHISVLA